MKKLLIMLVALIVTSCYKIEDYTFQVGSEKVEYQVFSGILSNDIYITPSFSGGYVLNYSYKGDVKILEKSDSLITVSEKSVRIPIKLKELTDITRKPNSHERCVRK